MFLSGGLTAGLLLDGLLQVGIGVFDLARKQSDCNASSCEKCNKKDFVRGFVEVGTYMECFYCRGFQDWNRHIQSSQWQWAFQRQRATLKEWSGQDRTC